MSDELDYVNLLGKLLENIDEQLYSSDLLFKIFGINNRARSEQIIGNVIRSYAKKIDAKLANNEFKPEGYATGLREIYRIIQEAKDKEYKARLCTEMYTKLTEAPILRSC